MRPNEVSREELIGMYLKVHSKLHSALLALGKLHVLKARSRVGALREVSLAHLT